MLVADCFLTLGCEFQVSGFKFKLQKTEYCLLTREIAFKVRMERQEFSFTETLCRDDNLLTTI
jgi:hypothetical protein